ncbi:AlpA family transcriptional regulator [Pseudomonas mediterranea]|uniref:AlpA family transcriptional regulator n=1 Tax=Pseudomonas mediterranea TaxID=183795 RepID=UPI0009E838B2|nr:AlpA family transcriptional regulator [Pseudomonas mediterranea]
MSSMMLQSDLPPPQQERRILRRPEVEQKTGLKRSYLYHLMNLSKFPKPIRIGVRAVGWNSAEVDQWIADRLEDRD